eukprot:PhF_6_TR6959/c0_g1_i2/m.10262/K10415/DYNC1I, DNCI; dynein intermediate chain, cytosolic
MSTNKDALQKELEEKKRRIQAMKDARLRSETNTTQSPTTLGGGVTPTPTPTIPTPTTTPTTAITRPSVITTTAAQSLLSDVVSTTTPTPIPPTRTTTTVHLTTTLFANLFSIVGAPPKENYSKLTQTTESGVMATSAPAVPAPQSTTMSLHVPQDSSGTNASLPSPSSSTHQPVILNQDVPDDEDIARKDNEVREEETRRKKEAALALPSLNKFVEKSVLVMERALSINRDVFLERAAGVYDSDEVMRHSKEVLQKHAYFVDEQLSRNCAVTSVSFQPTKGSEFFVASYREMGSSSVFFGPSSDSVVLGWSVHVPRPAFKLTTPLDVTQVQYCQFRANLVIGGTYTGQVVLWDTRKGESPVITTPVLKETHTNPVFGMNMIGTDSTHQLVTVSNDGKMCTWNLDKMTVPVEKTVLQVKEEVGDTAINKPIACTSIDFSQYDSEKFFVGGENGTMYSASRHSAQQSLNKVDGHNSPVTAVHCHPATSTDDGEVSSLVVSSSLDWTCKLWYEERSQLTLLHTFNDYTEYVYDVKWSPTHSAILASADGNGIVSLWNLARQWNMPLGRYRAGHEDGVTTTGAAGGGGGCAFNRLSWSMDGKILAAGDTNGGVCLLEVSAESASSTQEEQSRLRQNIMSSHNTASQMASRRAAM